MWIKLVLLFFAFSLFFKTDTSFDQDLGRHIKLGEIIVNNFSVPKTNLFSYTNPDFPFINTHWFFEVIAYFFAQLGALQLLLILKVIIILLSVWIILKLIPKENTALLLPIGFIFLHVLRERVELRPEIFSFLFTALTYYILEASLRAKRSNLTSKGRSLLIFTLPIIQFIWINTHIYFFVGLVLQAIFLIHIGYHYLRSHLGRGLIAQGSAKLKPLGIIFILSVLVSLINPNGLNGLLYPLNVTKNYGYSIAENQTMFLLESINFRDPNFLFVKISVGIILLSIIFVILNAVKNLIRSFELRSQDDKAGIVKNILLSLFGLTLALMHVRSFPYLVFLSFPAVLQNFGVIRFKGLSNILSFIICILLLLESFFYLSGIYYKNTDNQHRVGLSFEESGKNALDFVLSKDLPGPIFNNFDIGSYIIYRAYPKIKVFVDGRPEAYPAQFFQGIYIPSQVEYKNFKEVTSLYGFKTVIFSHTDQTPWGRNFLSSIIKDQDWQLIFIDDFMVILTKPEVANEKKLAPVDLASLNPTSYNFENHISYIRMGIFLINNQYPNGVSFIQKALQLNPNSPFANSIVGNPSQKYFFW